ncbi:unnamed protein product, partial [Allacma fusca]
TFAILGFGTASKEQMKIKVKTFDTDRQVDRESKIISINCIHSLAF